MTDGTLASIAVQIDQKTITATVERIVLQEIASKLGDPGVYFERVVRSCVMQTVDSNGNPSRSSYDNTTLIEYTANKAVTAFAAEVVRGWIEKNKAELEKAIVRALQKNVGSMAKVIAESAAGHARIGNINMSVTPAPER